MRANIDGRTLGPKCDGLHDGRNRLTKHGRRVRDAALAAMRAEFVESWNIVPPARVTLAELARAHGVPYGAASDASTLQGWRLEREAAWGRWYLETPPEDHYAPRDSTAAAEVVRRARGAVADWEDFRRLGYCEFHRQRWERERQQRVPPAAPAVDVRAAVVDLAAYRAERATKA